MSPISHFILSWSLGSIFTFSRKDRTLVTIAGVVPDIDGIGLGIDFLSKNADPSLSYFAKFHHVIGHNLGFGLIWMVITFLSATRRWKAALVAMAIFHIHLLCDLLGSRGPDGYQWPIPYLLPFSDAWQISWKGQWALNAWPNFAITGAGICFILYQSWQNSISPLEILSIKASDLFTQTLRNRFGMPRRLKKEENR